MKYGNIKYYATEDGIGCRTVLFVSGCRHHCKGCFQPQTWDFSYGDDFTEETENTILKSLDNKYVHGLTLLGGEPFEPENQKVLKPFIEKVKQQYPDKTIWAYSGYTFEELMDETTNCHTNDTVDILNMIDVLVDGEFIESEMSKMLPYRGSKNQRIIDIPSTLKKWSENNKTIILSEYHEKKIIK